MDAYNRGYGAGIADGGADDSDGLGEVGRIGNATLLARSDIGIGDADYDAWQTAGFYAVAYTMGADAPEGLAGKTVISDRGTDNPGQRGGAVSGGAGLLRHLHPLHSPASFVT